MSLAVGSSVSLAGPASAASKAKKTTVTISSITAAAGNTIVSGQKITIAGTASANLVGKRVAVQIRKGSKWLSFTGNASVKKDKTFKVSSKAADVGSVKYRVVFAGNKKLKKSTATKAATVWKWFNLVDKEPVESSSWYTSPRSTSNVTVAGTNYGTQLASSNDLYNDTTYSDFNLGYKCSQFNSKVGLTDSSKTGTSAQFTAFLDGNLVAGSQKTVNVGSVDTINLDANGVYRIRLQNQTFGSARAYVAWPQAKVLCKAKP